MEFNFGLLNLILLLGLQAHVVTAISDQSCSMSNQMNEECGAYAHRVVRPMLSYFEMVNQKIDKNDVIIDSKTNQIRQLQEKLTNFQLETDGKNDQIHKLEKEVASCTSKHEVIKLLKEKDQSNEELIQFLKHQVQDLMKSLEILPSTLCEKQTKEIAQLSEEIKSETEKANKCEIEVKIKQGVIAANDMKVLQLETEIKSLTDKSNELDSLKQQFSVLKNTNEHLNNNNTELNKGIRLEADKAIKCETELKSVRKKSDENQKTLNRIEGELKKANQEKIDMISRVIKKENAKSCIARDSTGVYNVTMCKGFSFEVQCNSDIAGPGWTIIQQRIKGGVDFYRNWETYRNGFGDFWDGDFFLGLEKIHRLTTEQPHELYIHMEQFDGSTFYARYNEFAIEGESDQYRVTKLSGFSGSKGVTNRLGFILNLKFSTYDRDNDTDDKTNCAEYHRNGWWNKICYSANLNGIYHESDFKADDKSVQWNYHVSLKQVKMMIRPKSISN